MKDPNEELRGKALTDELRELFEEEAHIQYLRDEFGGTNLAAEKPKPTAEPPTLTKGSGQSLLLPLEDQELGIRN